VSWSDSPDGGSDEDWLARAAAERVEVERALALAEEYKREDEHLRWRRDHGAVEHQLRKAEKHIATAERYERYAVDGSKPPRRVFVAEKFRGIVDLAGYAEITSLGEFDAIRLLSNSHGVLWKVGARCFSTQDTELTAGDVVALAHEAENRRRLKLEKAQALMAMRADAEEREVRQPIPQVVKLFVWRRDGGRCVECGSQKELEYDHIIPLAMGGSNTDRNLQLLCAVCNRRKGATLG